MQSNTSKDKAFLIFFFPVALACVFSFKRCLSNYQNSSSVGPNSAASLC